MICEICKEPIKYNESFSCVPVGEDEEGRIIVAERHFDCSMKKELTSYQKKILDET